LNSILIMQFFNQVREKMVLNMSRVKPIIFKKSAKRQNGADNSKERPPSPSSVSSTNSSVSGDPSVAETKGLLSKHSHTDVGEENDFSRSKKRTKNGEQETQTIVIRELHDKKTKETFQSIENDLEKLTSNGTKKHVTFHLNEERSQSTKIEIKKTKKNDWEYDHSHLVSSTKTRRKVDPWESEVDKEENSGHQYLEMKKFETKVRVEKEAEILEDMCNVVDRLQTISIDVNKELGVQSKMIEEISEEVEDAQNSFVMLAKKMDHLINTEKKMALELLLYYH